jgi:hypothetical protein
MNLLIFLEYRSTTIEFKVPLYELLKPDIESLSILLADNELVMNLGFDGKK